MRLFVNKFPFIYEYQKRKEFFLLNTHFGIKCRLRNERVNILTGFLTSFFKIYLTNLPYNQTTLILFFKKLN